MNQHITTELVETIASREVNRLHATGNHPHMHSWDETPPIEKHRIREAVLANLNAIIPVLLDAGWMPPVCETCNHQHRAGVCGSGLGGDSICWCQTEDGAA